MPPPPPAEAPAEARPPAAPPAALPPAPAEAPRGAIPREPAPPAKPQAQPLKPVPPAAVPPHLAGLEDVRRHPFLTRALLALLLDALSGNKGGGEGVDVPIMSDILDHPSRGVIIGAVASGWMDVPPNHQFKPEGLVSRAQLADTLARFLAGRGPAPPSTEMDISDMPASNRHYHAVRQVLGLGVMCLDRDGSFRPADPVGGTEAWETILRLKDVLSASRP